MKNSIDKDIIFSKILNRVKSNDYKGYNPIFIIGMPRSGTKLLRDILNNNPQISIPISETLFIPHFIRKYGIKPNFNVDTINEIINDIESSTFYYYLKKEGFVFDKNDFKNNIDYNSMLSIIKYVLTSFSEKKVPNIIWGDKTPSYINEIEILNKSFQDVKFIHIIRDPRDNAISANKAWNKNIYRVAYRWNKSIVNLNKYLSNNKVNIIEIKYEDLLKKPEKIINEICIFLDVRFDKKMLILRKSAENIGDAKGEKKIVADNKNKFLLKLNKKQIKKIEGLAFGGMRLYDYNILYAPKQKELDNFKQNIYLGFDIINRIIFNLKNYGISEGLKYTFKSLKKVNL